MRYVLQPGRNWKARRVPAAQSVRPRNHRFPVGRKVPTARGPHISYRSPGSPTGNDNVQPQRIRNTVELYPPMIVHRLILLLPVAYGGWSLWRGRELPVLFWGLVAATVLFYLFAKVPPYLRLSPTGLKFAQKDALEILWSDLKQ